MDDYNKKTVWDLMVPYAQDQAVASLVCKNWYEITAVARKNITIANCYSISPQRVFERFTYLEYMKIKGRPCAFGEFNLIPEDWGGYIRPWVEEVVRPLRPKLKALHFKRMIVTDADLEMLATSSIADTLQVLKLECCKRFSTNGLLHLVRLCRSMRIFNMEKSTILEHDWEWLRELPLNNIVLEELSFYMTNLTRVNSKDIKRIATRCPNLTSIKVSDCDISDLIDFFKVASSLEEFGIGSSNEPQPQPQIGELVVHAISKALPPRLCRLGLPHLSIAEMTIVYHIASKLTQLDLLYARLDTESHCLLLQRCPNLEFLQVRTVIGDRGLIVLARCCTRIKRLRILLGTDEQVMEDEGGVSDTGLVALALGCRELEQLNVFVRDITNESLEYIGKCLKELRDFRLCLIKGARTISDLPLDFGVKSVLRGCEKLTRLDLELRTGWLPSGWLTDVGLGFIGRNSQNIRRMLLGFVGETDRGLEMFSRWCRGLRHLEIRRCTFSENAVALAAIQLTSVTYLWVQFENSRIRDRALSHMVRPGWVMELIPERRRAVRNGNHVFVARQKPHLLAYYSVDGGRRTDAPGTITLM